MFFFLFSSLDATDDELVASKMNLCESIGLENKFAWDVCHGLVEFVRTGDETDLEVAIHLEMPVHLSLLEIADEISGECQD